VVVATTRRPGLVEQLRAEIRTGGLPLGQRLPPESDLASTFGVGRNTVREAVRALAHAGLLEVRHGDATFVRATTEISGALRRLPGSELCEVLELCRVLEVEGEGSREPVSHTELLSALAEEDAERAAREAAGFLDELLSSHPAAGGPEAPA
jgi:DNA-binding GntR family transcriptional regulator